MTNAQREQAGKFGIDVDEVSEFGISQSKLDAMCAFALIGMSSLLLLVILFTGCKTGTSARFEQRKAIGVTSTNLGEWTVPVIALSEGPSATIFQSKDIGSIAVVEGSASTTNRTSALGIYECEERKSFNFKGRFMIVPTNNVDAAQGNLL